MSDNKDDFGTDLKRKNTEKNNISDPHSTRRSAEFKECSALLELSISQSLWFLSTVCPTTDVLDI